ncbi:MAG: heat-inducible transcriptional repressor HrcA [Candidatus Omnitrophica bacterium]|nr:heat-inducible transcriptional repressor HrcA [Candidatus Omnitrophota bacterium]
MSESELARRDKILEFVIRSYVETAEPVGSRTICRRFNVRLSPASIRNVMADLEEGGFLTHPHPSAGRIPTDKGYRYYVDCLMEPEELGSEEKETVLREIMKARTLEGLAQAASRAISKLTRNAALIYIKKLRRVSFLTYLLEDLIREAEKLSRFFEEDSELFVEGLFHVFEEPEFQDIRKMRLLLHAFDEKGDFLRILGKDLEEEGVHVHIGHENGSDELGCVSLVVKDSYFGGEPIGGVALVGPTRMRYAKNVAAVNYVANCLSEAAGRF